MKISIRNWRRWLFSSLLCVLGIQFASAGELKTEAGIPTTLAELNRWYPTPLANGAVYFLKAYQTFSNNVPLDYYTNQQGQVGGYISWPPDVPVTNGPLPRAVKNSLKPFVRAMDMAWPSLEQGAKCGPCRYPVDLTQVWDAWLLHLVALNGDSMGCLLRATSEADTKHGEAAVESVLMGLAIAQSLKLEPLLISQEVRGNFQRRAVIGLEQVINRVALPANTLEHLQQEFNQLETEETQGDDFERGLVGTKLVDISVIDSSSNQLYKIATNYIEAHWITNSTAKQIPELIAKGWKTRDADRKLMGETFDKMLSLWKEGYPKRFEIDEIYKALVGDLSQRQFGFLPLADTEAPPRYATDEGGAIARLRLAKTAVALERYRARHENEYPDSLSALVPDFLATIPEDVFAEAPLQYHRRGNGYVLYSIGADRKDDDGDSKNDVVFETINPPGRAIIE